VTIKIIFDPAQVPLDFSNHVFAQSSYLKASSEDYGWFVGAGYVLPFYIDKILFFKRLIFTTAPLEYNSTAKRSNVHQFLDAVIDLCKNNNLCDFISKPQSNAVFPIAPSQSIHCEWGSYVTNIDGSDEDLLKSFHSKHRNVIIKAIKDGVTVSQTTDYVLVQACIKETVSRQNVPYFPSLEFVQTLYRTMESNVLMMAAHYNGELQGVALVLHDMDTGYYLYGGSTPKPHSGSLNLLQYEVMRHLKGKGLKHYDFVGARLFVEAGSKYEGIQRFKSRFGAELQQGYAFRVVFSPFKYHLFNLMAKTYCLLKGWQFEDSIDQLRDKTSE
jgi:hypothetical protein